MPTPRVWTPMLAVLASGACGSVPPPVRAGSQAPPFTARTLDGPLRERGLEDYRGHVVLLNVWATWCVPCQTEMPSIERLYRELGPRGLRVVAVSIDDGGSEESIREFAREFGLTFDILHDPSGGIMRDYQMLGVPTTFLIGADGIIRHVAFESDWFAEQNRRRVASLLPRSGE